MNSMEKSTLYSTMILKDDYYQIFINETDVAKMEVSPPNGMLWEYLVMQQELKNAPATFN